MRKNLRTTSTLHLQVEHVLGHLLVHNNTCLEDISVNLSVKDRDTPDIQVCECVCAAEGKDTVVCLHVDAEVCG